MRDDSPLWISQWRSAVCNRHWSHTKGKVQSQPPVIWPCCNLIIWEHRGKLALDISYLVSVMCTEHTQTPSLSQPHTDGKVLSQHPQIRLHVAFPIRGFLERLNPECRDIPASRAEHRLIFLCMGSERWLAGGSAMLIPDFHKIRGRAVSTATTANYRCDTHMQAYAHTHTCDLSHARTHTHRNMAVQKRISPGSSHQSEVNKPHATPPPTSLSSHLRQEGTCQRMLSSPSGQSSQRRRQSENKWTLREPIKILRSLRSAGHWWKSD